MAQDKRTAGNEVKLTGGPYIATVVGHLDPNYMGAIEVQLLKINTSNNQGLEGQSFKVKYASPFLGQTPASGLSNNKDYKFTQQAYGFWMTPPDIGTRVIVVFVEGQANMGYWIGCVQDNYVNFSMPDRVATGFVNDVPKTPGSQESLAFTGKAVVGEINKRVLDSNKGNDPTKFLKPINEEWMSLLHRQGLNADGTRGLTSSSARREVPSMVFGISTPGPYDKRPGFVKTKYGTKGTQADIPFGRLGGTSFVMDDGDDKFLRKGPASTTAKAYANVGKKEKGSPDLPANELMRIRTRTGHQILFHNTEDLIRIDHGSGNSWIEMTANGKIDVYSKDSISMHTENDLNITADRDINMEAGRTFNLKTASGINLETMTSIQTLASISTNITSGTTSNINSGLGHFETAMQIHMNGPEATIVSPLSTHVVPGATATATASLHKRLPQHEPWEHHENVTPLAYTPEETDRTNDVEIKGSFDIDSIPDTFKKDGA